MAQDLSAILWGGPAPSSDAPVGEGASLGIQNQWNTGSAAPTDEQLHMQHNQFLADQYQKQAKVEGYLQTIFGDGQDVEDPRKLSLAASAIMHLDPKMAMGFAQDAMRLRKESAAEDKEAFKEKEATRVQGAATLASASADSYRSAMNEYVRLGNRLPPWYTGNYDNDKPYVDQAVGAGVKAGQQAQQQAKKFDQLMRLEDLLQKGAFHSQEARKLAFKAVLGTNDDDVAEKWAKEEGQAADAVIANKRTGKESNRKTANTNDVAQVMTQLRKHEKFDELDPDTANKVASLAASEARRDYSQPDNKDDYLSIANDKIDEIINGMNEGPRKFDLPVFGKTHIFGSGKSLTMGSKESGKAQSIMDMSKATEFNPGKPPPINGYTKFKGKLYRRIGENISDKASWEPVEE